MLHKNVKMTVLVGKFFAATAFILTSTILSSCGTPEPQKPEVPTQPQKPQTLNNQQSNQVHNDDKEDDKDDDKDNTKDNSKEDKD